MQQYPIYNRVEACIYKSNKSYGAKDTSSSHIFVGSSAKNSHLLAEPCTTKRFKFLEKYNRVVISFRFYVDGICLKEMIFEDNNGKAGALLESNSILGGIVGIGIDESISELA